MDETNKDTISTLNSLIETCNDGAKGFESAAEEVHDTAARQLFRQFASERSQFADELRTEVQRLGGSPDQGGSVSGAMHRGWMNVKSAVAGHDDSAIIASSGSCSPLAAPSPDPRCTRRPRLRPLRVLVTSIARQDCPDRSARRSLRRSLWPGAAHQDGAAAYSDFPP
jgi:uncharacterized protein DUF2383